MKAISTSQPKGDFTQALKPQHFYRDLKILVKKIILLVIASLSIAFEGFGQTTQSFNNSTTWVCPVGVNSVTVECWGGGAGGGGNTTGSDGGGGGGGGAYSRSIISVVPGTSYPVTVGGGGNGGTGTGGTGGDSWFITNGTILAKGGTGGFAPAGGIGGVFGNGGLATSGIGTVKFSGGNGGTGRDNGTGQGGPGGSSAGTALNGTSGPVIWSTITAAAAPTGGAVGGNGGNSGGNGGDGNTPGAGGGGAGDVNFFSRSGGDGANGRVSLTYTQLTYRSQISSPSLGSSTWCPGETRNVSIQVTNIGTATWTNASPDINVGIKWNTNGANWADYYVRVDAGNLAPGATGTYVFTITAANNTGAGYTTNLAAGTNNLIFDVVYEGVSWFGDNGGGVGPGNIRFVSSPITISSPVNRTVTAASSVVCTGGETNITVASSTSGTTTYQLRNDANDANIGSAVTGNGSTISLPTGNLTSTTTFNVLATITATGCTAQMSATPTVTVLSPIANNTVSSAQTICSGATPAALNGSSPSGGNTPYSYNWESSTTGASSGFGNASGTRTNQNYTPPAALTQTTWYRRSVTSNTGGCTSTSAAIEITVNPLPAQVLVSGGGVFCNNATLTATNGGDGTIYFQGTTTGGTSTSTPSTSIVVNATGTYYFRARSSAGCWGPQGSAIVNINPLPSAVTALPASTIICSGVSTNLSGSATINSTSVLTLMNDNFDSPTFTSVTSGTPTGNRTQAWAPEVSGTNVNSIATFTSPNGGNMMVATCGASSLGSSSLNTSLTSQSISINAVTSLTLTFRHTFGVSLSGGDVGTIVISTDNGSNWSSPVATYNTNIGTSTSFQTVNIPLNSFVGQTNLLIRFNFTTSNALGTSSWWAIDDVQLTGSAPNNPLFSWTANPPTTGGLPPDAGTFLATNSSISVNPTETTTYTLTAKDPITNCVATATSTVTVNKAPAFTTCPANIAVNNDAGQCNAVVTYAPVITGTPTPIITYAFAGATSGSGSGTGSESAFNVGVTNVTITATNSCSPAAECTFTVTVTDNENPAITCDDDIIANNDDGQCGKSFPITAPSATDNCAVDQITGTRSDALLLTAAYPVGTTTITWTVTDIHGKTATCDQVVTIKDVELPKITCPADITRLTPPTTAFASIDLQLEPQPVVTDNCGVATVVNDHPSTQFPIGLTKVTWTVTDVNGNVNTCEQYILVNDEIQPDITCNLPININNTPGICEGATDVSYPAASDNSGFVTVTSDYSGLPDPYPTSAPYPLTTLVINNVTFPVGITNIIWTATDPSDNTNSCLQKVTVTDNEPPTITCPANVIVSSDAGVCTASGVVLGTPTTVDNCGGILIVSNDHPGNVYGLGETIVTWTVKDVAGNISTCEQTVTVTDNQNPTITAPGDIVVSSDAGICTASGVVLGTPTTADNCSVASVTSDATEPYALGTTTITWTVTDGKGNTAQATQTVTVTDNQNPTITAPGNVTVSSDAGICTASGVALGTPTTADNCSVASVTNNATQPFALGYTIVTWTVKDGSGNTAQATQTVTVTDNQNPTITAPSNVTVSSDGGLCTASGVTLGIPTTLDNCGIASVTNDAIEPYALGTTTITWTVTDGSGNKATAIQTVTVTDDQDPTITAPANVFANSDAGICTASGVVLGTPTVADNCIIESVTNDAMEPFALGNTIVTWTITDGSGNTAQATQTITVSDNEKPVITCPANATINCQDDNSSAATGVATATDNCSQVSDIVITQNDISTQDANVANAGHYNYTITRTWRATDVKGNYIECDQILTVQDITAPVISCPGDVTLNCEDDNTSTATDVATATDNCTPDANISITESDVSKQNANVANAGHYNYTITRTWRATDVTGNFSECMQTITVRDIAAPLISCPADVTLNCQDDNTSASTGVATGTDNCSPVTITESSVSTQDADVANPGHYNYTITRTWRATDVTGNYSECVQNITVQDINAPAVSCTSNKSVNPNNTLCTYKQTGTAWDATATDNCSSTIIKYTLSGATTSATDAFTTLNDVVFNLGVTTVTAVAYDASNNASASCSFTVSVTNTVGATFTNSNNILYYGYTGDQTSVITVKPTGGMAPYSVSFTMNRPLKCNFINDAGDEIWNSGSGATITNSNTTCPANPLLATVAPVSTKTGIAAGGSYAITLTLMKDATIYFTVTDKNGCTYLDSTKVEAEDVRCFAGNSGNVKVTLCHKTGSTKNPCVKICVDESAVQEHLDHGDFPGNCNTTCTAPPPPVSRAIMTPIYSPTLEVKVMPNPTPTFFNVVIKGRDASPVTVRVIDVYGRTIQVNQKIGAFSTLRLGDKWPSGTYMVEVFQGTERKVIKVIKAK